MEIKQIAIGAIAGLAIGAGVMYLAKPENIKTEIKTVEVVKKEKQNVYIDRVITKEIKPDGTIKEVITEKDRTKTDRMERVDEALSIKEHVNPKRFGLGISYKANALDLSDSLDYTKNLGIEVLYNTGFLGTFGQGQVFLDGTVILTLGVMF